MSLPVSIDFVQLLVVSGFMYLGIAALVRIGVAVLELMLVDNAVEWEYMEDHDEAEQEEARHYRRAKAFRGHYSE